MVLRFYDFDAVANVKSYDYWTVVSESSVIPHHFSSIVIFTGVFINIYNDFFSIETLIAFSTVLTISCYVYWDFKVKPTLKSLKYSSTSFWNSFVVITRIIYNQRNRSIHNYTSWFDPNFENPYTRYKQRHDLGLYVLSILYQFASSRLWFYKHNQYSVFP